MNKITIKKIITVITAFMVVILPMSVSASASSGTVYESESNDTYGTADRTYNDRDNYGKISSSTDVDWWTITFSADGCANFWLGNIPSGCDYDIALYASDGTTLLASSTSTSDQELINYTVTGGSKYYIKIYSYSGYSNSQYIFRAKNYTLPPLLKGNLIWNIESIYYYVDPSAYDYLTHIADAANNWCYTGYGFTKLYPNTRTTVPADAAIEIYAYSSDDGANGYTTFWARENGTWGDIYQTTYNKDWLFNKINLNSLNMNKKSSAKKQAVVTHEMGHCFGLNENNSNTQSIMCQELYERAVDTVQKVDHIAFNRKHP